MPNAICYKGSENYLLGFNFKQKVSVNEVNNEIYPRNENQEKIQTNLPLPIITRTFLSRNPADNDAEHKNHG